MAQSALARTKINTEVTQAVRSRKSRASAGPRKPGRPPRSARLGGTPASPFGAPTVR